MGEALYPTLDALRSAVQEFPTLSAAYVEKMLHKLPDAQSVDRVPWLLERLKGKAILHVGCVGALHDALLKACTKAYGLDHVDARYPDYCKMDIEAEELPHYEDVEVVLLAEVLEHVTSVGVLLWQVRTKYPGREVIITTPNAYSAAGYGWAQKGYENVNKDHTCFFSWRTMKTLLDKCGYDQQEFYWYNGPPKIAEGLIVVARAV